MTTTRQIQDVRSRAAHCVHVWTTDRHRDGVRVEGRITRDVAGLLARLNAQPGRGGA